MGSLLALPGIARDFTYEYEGKTLTYTVIDEDAKTCMTKAGENVTVPGNDVSGDLKIPSVAKDGDKEYTVKGIGNYSFSECQDLTSVTIPNSVTTIGDAAFYRCSGLPSVVIPNSVTSLGEGTFQSCSGLTSVTISNSLKTISEGAFAICSSLSSVTIPYSVTTIGEYAFSQCEALTYVYIPSKVTTIVHGAFIWCSGLTSVSIPTSVTTIGENAFKDCEALKTFTVKEGKETIAFGVDALKNAPIETLNMGRNWTYATPGEAITTGMKTVTIGNGVSRIDENAFRGCSNLKTFTVDEGKESIAFDADALKDAPIETLTLGRNWTYAKEGETLSSGIKGLILGTGVNCIPEKAFSGCSNLSYVIIPYSVNDIGPKAFENCYNLFSAMIQAVCDIADDVFPANIPQKVACYEQMADNFKDRAIWFIEEGETYDPKGIIWAADKKSGFWVFGNYSGELRIPDGMTQMAWVNFAMCPGITEVYLPNTLEVIGNDTFNGTTLKEIVLPNRVNKLYEYTFRDVTPVKMAYPDNLEVDLGESETVLVGYDAFDSKVKDNFVYSRSEDALYYVPLNVTPKFEVPSTVKKITDKAFVFCDNLTEVVLPENLTELGENVWQACGKIEKVVCTNPNPIEASSNIFDNKVYDNATLLVPDGCKAKYSEVAPWKYFYNIAEGSAGIDDIVGDENNDIDPSAPAQYYNLQGVAVGDSVENLVPGIYIVRQGNTVKKILVK